ncbi:MAG TPA: patatin-like phospholipase family protein, partial [Flavobacteriales bacterium]|nr:patatin-like phospholipase family protein [Flavobacteriales bacterium]
MIAFVLSGGGNRGALQAGALLALLERGIRPDLIVGTSVGALNG